MPSFYYENRLWKKNYKNIAGVDEAGRGAWAGPIVAGAVILKKGIKKLNLIRDSKTLNQKQREKLFKLIIKQAKVWSVGVISEKLIDRLGIAKANFLAIKKALKKLKSCDYFLIDGIGKIDLSPLKGQRIKKGDQKVYSISCASIIAKVWRDQLMIKHDKKYPQYGFSQHKGYGTFYHRKMISKYGLCRLHRKTFQPMKSLSH
jgi:ribonuclease HII